MERLITWFMLMGLEGTTAVWVVRLLSILAVIILAYMADRITKRILIKIVEQFARGSKTKLDDILLKHNFFKQISHLAPAIVIYHMAPVVLAGTDSTIAITQRVVFIYMLIVGVVIINALLNSVSEIYETFEVSRRVSIRSFIQAAKVLFFLVLGIIILSVIIDKSPAFFFGGLGAMAAVLMLVFKDSILGFVAGIQMSANQMVRIGDWIEMPKYGADGDVIDIALTTVKVRNWDKTVTTIPAYAMISDSFKNWRGMSESGGRRIKRAVYIDMTSIQFCTHQMLDKFKRFQYITEYIERKRKELAEYNAVNQVDDSELVNGRRLTNIGTFRAYLVSYLRNHPKIHQDMTFLIRQLAPTDHGLPIEIYVFSNDQRWANYEAIQSDIFDHILSIIPEFELRIFQNPTGSDFQYLKPVQPRQS